MRSSFQITSALWKCALVACVPLIASNSFAEKPVAGLSVIYSSGKESATASAQNVRLYVNDRQTPSPLLAAGKFSATWNGFISADLRGDYFFQLELNGTMKLEINQSLVLDVAGTNSLSEMSKAVRLSKGTNLFKATFTAPANGDAFVRLNWKPRGSFAQPIPMNAFSHFPSNDEQQDKKLLRGRELFVEHRCGKCHTATDSGMPELEMDAPSFEGIGSRRNFEWMSQWIANPKALRPSAHMPKSIYGEKAQQEIEDIADFLTSLTNARAGEKNPSEDKAVTGQKLFEELHCVACHNDPGTGETDAKKIGLKSVAVKFAPGMLSEFLKKPDVHYVWIRMPEFKLTEEQFDSLAAYLISKSDKPTLWREASSSENINRGKKLVQSSGCLNCHSLKLENQFSTKTLARLSDWRSGCLADDDSEKSAAPHFGFSDEEREALRVFGASDKRSLTRHVPAEFAERQVKNLNCIECHNKIEGVPRLELLGGKLKPEWSAKFMAGQVEDKPRPWIAAQMPAFPKHAKFLAEGLAGQHGIPPHTRREPEPNADSIEAGRKLVSTPPLGFSCVSCHAVGKAGASQFFESPGINLAHTGERLLPEFFKRWMRSPGSIDPITKMPTYFDEEGNSPLTDVYDGNGEKQINAMWHYIRLGEKMPAPAME